MQLMPTITESSVVRLWDRLARSGREFQTVEGEPLRVIYPGRTSDEPGSDIRDAVLRIGGREVKGAIEVHVGSRGWQAHRHDRDRTYNGIVLHVVLQHDALMPTCLENGVPVPVVALQDCPETVGSALEPPSYPCSRLPPDLLTRALDDAGMARFEEKAAAFRADMQASDPAQVLHEGIMRALGYSRNCTPFLTLARRLPLSALEPFIKQRDELGLEARLFGMAGLLPSQRTDAPPPVLRGPYVQEIEARWRAHPCSGSLTLAHWRLFRVRPGNHPARRLAGMVRLLRRHGDGLLEGLMTLVAGASPEDVPAWLEAGLTVPAEGYWADHYDFGRSCPNLGLHLIGGARVVEIVVNVLLPFGVGWGQGRRAGHLSHAKGNLSGKASRLFATHPAADENAIGRQMRAQLGLKRAAVSTAERQQGLLHLYKRYCTQGRCGECPLGKYQWTRDKPQ